MTPHRFRCCLNVQILALLAFCFIGGPSWGQKPPPPPKPNPAAPVLAPVVPLGAQRGQSVELTLTGTNLAGPTGILLSFPAKVIIPTENKNGQDNAKLLIRVEVPADAPLGYHTIRLATARGMSNLRIFCIDDLPQVMEKETNKNKTTPQELSPPCVAVGRIEAEVSDWYKVTAKAGQRLTFEVFGRRLGSDLDPQLSLYSVKSGREVAHDNDAPGCQSDPRLTYTFKEDGDYLIEIKDVLNRGGADYWYRMRVGDFPCATAPVPMAVKRGTKAQVGFAGPLVEGVAAVEVDVPADAGPGPLWVAPKGANGLYGWPVAVAVSDHEELVEQEPNNDSAKANRLPVPCGVTGRFGKSADTDFYLFTAKKGQKLLIDVQTLEYYSPTLVYFVLRNAKTKAELAKSNPQAPPPADQRVEFTAPEDGDYLIEMQHLNFQGGPGEVYRLTVTPSAAGFELTVPLERFDVAAGGTLALPVTVNRRGYAGPIEVSVTGHEGVSGKVTIPAGDPGKPGDPAKGGKAGKPNPPGPALTLKVSPDVKSGPYVLALVGKATVDGKEVVEAVSFRVPVSQSMANLPYPPRQLFGQLVLAVTPPKPAAAFELKVEPAVVKLLPGEKAKFKIIATRKWYEGPITLELRNLPPNVTAGKAMIAAKMASVEVELVAAPNAAAMTRADVAAVGTATGAGNAQAASPNFTVSVGKK